MAQDAYTKHLLRKRAERDAYNAAERERIAREHRNNLRIARQEQLASASPLRSELLTGKFVTVVDMTGTYPDMKYPIWTPPPGRQRTKRSNRA